MSLKDDIQDIAKVLKYEPPTTMVLNAKEALSRIEAALSERTISEKEWVDRLYDVRMESDKLLIMVTNRRAELRRSALAIDDGPPREGDVVVFPGFPHREFALIQIFHSDFEGQKPIILMRAEEVEQRIKEAGK